MPIIVGVWFAVVMALVGGWISNVVKLATSDFTTIDGLEVLRFVGLFLMPIGGILGYF